MNLFSLPGNQIAEYDQNSGVLLREYVWHGLTPVAVIEGGAAYFIRVDHIGKPVFATDSLGTKVWQVSYDPFGGVVASTGTPANIRFPGQWFQSESGLHQNWMRDYDPTTGRYLQADPLGLVDGASVYGYARGNPLQNIDPTGEIVPAAIIAGIAMGMIFEAVTQFFQYGTNFQCWDMYAMVKAGAIGGAFGAVGRIGSWLNPYYKSRNWVKTVNWKGGTRAQNFFEESHFLADRVFKSGIGSSRIGKWFNNSGLNTTFVTWKWHARTDRFAYRFLSRLNKSNLGRRFGEQAWLRTPPWLFLSWTGSWVSAESDCTCVE